MKQPEPDSGASRKFADLRLRLISAAGLAALALGAIWLGGVWTALLAALGAFIMMQEWRSITAEAGGAAGGQVAPYAIGVVGGVLLLLVVPAWMAVLFLLGAAIIGVVFDAGQGRLGAGLWSAFGALYVGGAAMALLALRGFDPFGLVTIIWAVLIVIGADVGGYFAGRIIGGPKLWPRVSPNKTWAGMLGGVGLALVIGVIFSSATTDTYFLQVGTVSALMAMVSQAGDLGESALKRHFGVKDSGNILPGHGGLLDRLDGHLPAMILAALLTFSRGQAVFVW
ncbi:MAG TPA: phosphatidate cytidylyltransferase [Paracoccaceae bacterium]|nr:phosphatidate cytidylyltransferase [Paracoccaceae bacterium]